LNMFAEQPPVLFGDLKAQQRLRLRTKLSPQRAVLSGSRQRVLRLQQASHPMTLTHLVNNSHTWFSPTNRAEAEQYLQGACLAYKMQLPHQIGHYTAKLVEVYTRDMADQTSALVSSLPGSTTFRHFEADHNPQYQFTFTIPIASEWWGVQMEWLVCPLVEFPKMMPVHALQAVSLLEQARIVPDGFWVADKVEVVQRVSLDPILCCNFDRWFVGLAQWA
jgi:hypothetical protein